MAGSAGYSVPLRYGGDLDEFGRQLDTGCPATHYAHSELSSKSDALHQMHTQPVIERHGVGPCVDPKTIRGDTGGPEVVCAAADRQNQRVIGHAPLWNDFLTLYRQGR